VAVRGATDADNQPGDGTVTPTIETLLAIQEHDCRILKCERELQDLPARKAAVEGRLEAHRQARVKAHDELKSRQAAIKEAEVEIDARRERIHRLREQQMQIKTNREFRAIEDEVTAMAQTIRRMEDDLLDLMEGLETYQAGVRKADQELKAEEEAVRAEVQSIESRGAAVKAELEEHVRLRDQGVAEADPAWYERYARIFQNKKDKALVPVENGACGGCHMRLPPYLCHEARKQNHIVTCEFCGRLLC
jgi:predicted  nucleic acid-binding Zn-ribbon protein